MALMKRMIDMVRSDEEKLASRMEGMFSPMIDTPDVPPGLCLCLTEAELEKLDLEDECEIGDLLHATIMAKVTSISKNDNSAGCKVRIELSIVAMSIENEMEESPGEEDEME